MNEFPRSKLLKLICDHPVAATATLAALVYFGPAKVARLGMVGLQTASRNANSIAPVLQQVLRNRRR